jgi:hypothetical protein
MNPLTELFETSSTYWLAVFAGGLVVCAGYLWRCLFGFADATLWRHRILAIAASLVTCLTAVDGLNLVHGKLSKEFRLPGTLGVIAATAFLTWMHLHQVRVSRNQFFRRPTAWLAMASCLLLVGWSSARFRERLNPVSKKPFVLVRTPSGSQAVQEFVALTDRGHPIRVFRLTEEGAAASLSNDVDTGMVFENTDSIIRRSAPDSAANCHGWVFLDGQYLISGEAVQRILDDNGYELVSEPSAGDVIIYRGNNREIVHSGIVRGILNDGTVMIESKWGAEGCYLHDPRGQPYSQSFEYYHSPRPVHKLTVIPTEEFLMDD